MSATKSQVQPETSEKKETPWRITFTCKKKQPFYSDIEKDLLTACWGNQKMTGVLYHLLCVGSWRASHAGIAQGTRSYILQESHAQIRAKLKLKISEPTLITYLKLFEAVGYIQKAARKEALTIHFDVIEKAFLNPPDKPVIDNNLSSNLMLNLNLNDRRDDELDKLRCQVEILTSQVHDLSLTLVRFSSLCAQLEHEFKLNFSSRTKEFKLNFEADGACGAVSDRQNTSENLLDNRIIEIDHREREKSDCATAPSPCLPAFLNELDCLAEDCIEAQLQQASTSYSPHAPTATPSQPNQKMSNPAGGASYTNVQVEKAVCENETHSQLSTAIVDKPAPARAKVEKPARPQKPKVEQPVLIDPKPKGIVLTEDEQRIQELYCKLWFVAVPPKINETFQSHCRILIPFVHTLEEMESLERAARAYAKSIKKDTKVLPLGWFVNDKVLNAWVAEQKQEQSKISHIDEERAKRAEQKRVDDEKNQRNIEANRQAAKESMREKIANGKKLQNFEVVMAVERFGLELPPQSQYVAQYEQHVASKQQVVLSQ